MDQVDKVIISNPDLIFRDDQKEICIDLGKRNKYNGKTILHVMVEDEEETELLELLTQCSEQGTQVNSKPEEEAEADNRIRFLNLDVNAQDVNGWTPLIAAIIQRISNIEKVTKVFMQLGCDPFIAGKDGKNAFHWAARVGLTSVLRAIAEASPLERIHELLNTPTNDAHKLKPLYLAARFDHVEAFSYLMSLEQKNRET